MSNSVVKVTDDALNDSLLLLVGEDGTVTPDKETVQTYLNSQSGATNIQIMHINKSDSKGIDVSIDNLTYIPDGDTEEVTAKEPEMDDVARNLYNFRLDHDYTPFSFSSRSSSPPEEVDELAKTLSLLEGGLEPDRPDPIPIKVLTPKLTAKVIKTTPALISTLKHTTTKPVTPRPVQIPSTVVTAITQNISSTSTADPQAVKSKPKILNTQFKAVPRTTKSIKLKPRVVIADDDDDDDEDDEDFDIDFDEDDDNDSDFELEESRSRTATRRASRRKSETKFPPKLLPVKVRQQPEPKPEPPKLVEHPPEVPDNKPVEKKPPKKEKKPPKPIPDDFALFSTPDIIRRVGGKEPTTPGVDAPNSPTKPAKILQEGRSKSTTESSLPSPTKHIRLSMDGKVLDKDKHSRDKSKDRRISTDAKLKRTSVDERPKAESPKKSDPRVLSVFKTGETSMEQSSGNAEDLGVMMLNDEAKSFAANTLAMPVGDFNTPHGIDQGNMNLDTSGLDLDQTLLDNINNDLISDDILYQVAQSLVSNTELQNAIEKGLTEGNLVLDPSIQQAINMDPSGIVVPAQSEQDQDTPSTSADASHKAGTQIVRPDGRIVVIPPIERPATRSRNKKREDEKPVFKPIHKPLDDEHVSGNELDSSNEEEESEDDPNKLWCICNQPHNNRFMICCDTCEEWYHGKCVNITKTMGQQMESEGKEWICLFCKDPSLRRPQAAARRVRKASRNSRASTDSAGSAQKMENSVSGGGSVPCVVCQKPSRKNSIFCSETCILAHAQGVERVVVFERATGRMLTGNKAPSAANLDQWLKQHPGYEVVRSGGKIVTAKAQGLTQTKLKLVSNSNSDGASLAVEKKGINVGVLKHSPRHSPQLAKPATKSHVTTFKIISKHVNTKEPKAKLIQPQPLLTQIKSPTTPSTPSPKLKTIVTTPVVKKIIATPPSKEKPVPVKTPKARQAEQPSISQPKHENIRENVQKTLFEQLTNRLKLVEDLKLSEDDVKNISTEIESQLYKCFGDTGQKYRNKYRSLIFNIKDVKNQTLWRRICEKSINPYELVRLSPDDLASQELAMWREREAKHQLDMIKKSELELLNCNRQYVLKTHKGEQVLEDSRPTDNIDNTEVIKSLTEGSALDSNGEITKRDTSKEREKKSSSSKHSHKDKDRDSERKSSKDKTDSKEHSGHRASSRDKDRDRSRKRSRSRDHSSKHSDKKRSRSRDRDRHRRSSHKSSRHKKDSHISTTDKLDKKSKEILEQLVDNKIVPPLEDRLWKHVSQEDLVIPPVLAESDSDHEPTSTVTIPTPPRNSDPDDYQANQSSTAPISVPAPVKEKEEERSTSPPPKSQPAEIWRGTINMIDVAQISITAHEVSGECAGLGKELPGNLDIVGRISPDTVWDYIGKMKCSNSKIISLLRLNATNVEEKMPYLALYSYLSSRNRLGVVKSTNKAVKDFYILPLASQKPIPQALLPLNGPGFEESRPALLLGIIVRDKRKRPYLDSSISQGIQKRSKVETPPETPVVVTPARSYTPPPIKDPRLNKLPLPPAIPAVKDDDEEPYSPEDSDPDSTPTPLDTSTIGAFTDSPTTPSYQSPQTLIPGLGSPPVLPSSTLEIQRQMEELNKKIEMQKSEINSISQNIATASTEIGTSALANIALPSNLQQILDSIKTIGVMSATENEAVDVSPVSETNSIDLTIPLMIPKTFTRPLSSTSQKLSGANDTIPLNLPTKSKIKPPAVNSPLSDLEKPGSVLSSLSEEDLIRKAAEMLGETDDTKNKKRPKDVSDGLPGTSSPRIKRSKMEVDLPPVPGLD